MNNPAYDLFSWKCFVFVVKYGSVRQAAAALGLEPSSVSRRIASLSEALNTKLFEQSGRALLPTAAGRSALRNFAPIVKALEVAVDHVASQQPLPDRRIHIIAPSGYTMTILRFAVSRFSKLFPATQFWLESGRYGDENFESLGKGVDLILSTVARENAFFVRREISDHRNMCYASPEYLVRHPISHPDEYARHILGGNTQFITNQQFRSVKTGQTISMPLNFQLMSDNTNVLLEWAAAGDGILMSCPYTAGLDYVRRGALAVVLPEWRLPNNHVYAYAAKKDMTSPETPLSIFLDILQSASDTMKTASDLFYNAAESV